MRLHDLAPGQQAADRIDVQPPRLATLLVALKFRKLCAQNCVAHFAELLRSGTRADRLHQTTHGIQRPLGIVVAEAFIVREPVADIDQLVNDRALGPPEHGPEGLRPEPIHSVEQRYLIPGDPSSRIGPETIKLLGNPHLPVPAECTLQPLFDKGSQCIGQKLHTLEDILTRALGHALPPQGRTLQV